MGLFNLRIVETTPGANTECPFSPPAGWEGDETAYRLLMRSLYDTDIKAGQRILAQARFTKRHKGVEYRGPYAGAARQIINYLAGNS
jgi:hypothetical protein